MWCSSCRADVAAELSTDNRRMLCARCQSELGIAASAATPATTPPRAVETERDARELLSRWSAQNLLDATPLSSTSSSPKSPASPDSKNDRPQLRFDPPRMSPPPPVGAFAASKPNLDFSRVEQPEPVAEAAPPVQPSPLPPPEPPRVEVAPGRRSPTRSVVTAHDAEQDQDRVVRDALQKQLHRRLGWSSFAGQLFAYGGVAALTCGTVLIVWSYFGGPAQYLPTGLLTAAVGQMVLFLGVVTLISSGMEQTVHEVSWRIDHLAEEIYHVGLALDELENSHQQLRRQWPAQNSRPDDGSSRRAA